MGHKPVFRVSGNVSVQGQIGPVGGMLWSSTRNA